MMDINKSTAYKAFAGILMVVAGVLSAIAEEDLNSY